MNTNNKKEWEKVVSRAHMDMNGHCPLAEDEAIIEADKQIKQLEQERDALKAHCEEMRQHIRYGHEPAKDDESIETYSKKSVAILDKTSAQSLAEIQAQAIEPVLLDKYEYFDEHGKYTVVDVEDIKCRIQQLLEDT